MTSAQVARLRLKIIVTRDRYRLGDVRKPKAWEIHLAECWDYLVYTEKP